MATRDRLHRLVDQLPEDEVESAERYLEFLRATADPLLRALLAAPADDEETSAAEEAGLGEARADAKAGKLSALREVKRELGL